MPTAAGRREVGAVYGAALVQGVALVTFPAASSILTSADWYGLTSTAYGGLFLPQAVAAIGASLAGARLAGTMGPKLLLVLGLSGDLAAMALLFVSQFAIGLGVLPYLMLLAATTSLGFGFGMAVPSLNTFAAEFFPDRADRAVLYLNALLGLGTALAPVLVAAFVGLGFWSGLPLVVAVALAGLLIVVRGLPLAAPATTKPIGAAPSAGIGLPPQFWVFAAFAVCYGIVETMNGNWATLYMTQDLGASTVVASLALTTFWAMVTVGRILFAAIERWLPEETTFRLLPFVAAIALAFTALLPSGDAAAGVLTFGLAGLGCSALLPLTISFGQRDLQAIGASVAGLLIASYQVGYGVAAFGVGPLQDLLGIGLTTLFGATSLVALALGAIAVLIVRGHSRTGLAERGAVVHG
jgi:MFS family permease